MDLKLVTWNLQGSKGIDSAAVVARLSLWRPDVILLQEIRQGQAKNIASLCSRVLWSADRAGIRWARKHYPYSRLLWWRAEGLAIIARGDLDHHDVIELTPGVGSSTYRRRILQTAVYDHRHGEIRLYNTHLASSSARDERAQQAAIAAGAVAARRTTMREVLAGDLNAPPTEASPLAPFTPLGLADVWTTQRKGDGFTNPAGTAFQRLDYILSGPGWSVVSAEIPTDGPGWAHLSDHLPVFAHLRTDPPPS